MRDPDDTSDMERRFEREIGWLEDDIDEMHVQIAEYEDRIEQLKGRGE